MHSPLTTPINFCICVDSLIQLVSRTSYSVYVRIYPIYLNTRKGWTHTCGPLGESFCCLSGPLRHKIQVWSSLHYYFLHSTADKTTHSPFLTLYIRLCRESVSGQYVHVLCMTQNSEVFLVYMFH